MKIIDLNLNNLDNKEENIIVLGNFDGFHMGHLSLIKKALMLEKETGYLTSCLLFKEHSNKLINSDNNFKFLMSNQDKIQMLDELHIKIAFLISFDENFMKLSKENFVGNFLHKKLGVKSIVVGEDYTFAYKSSGTSKDLQEIGDKCNIKTYIAKDVLFNGTKVSSSLIREKIKTGDIKSANELLTRPYFIKGKVVHGKAREKIRISNC